MSPRLAVDKAELFKHLEYEPHPGQLEVHRSRASRRVLACGVRWDKSRCAAMEAVAAALEPLERSVGWVACWPLKPLPLVRWGRVIGGW